MGCFSCLNGPYSQLSGNPSFTTGKGKNRDGEIKFGYSLVKGKADHVMEDYHVAKFVPHHEHEVGLFAIFDGHLGHGVPSYLQKHLFPTILREGEFLTDTGRSMIKAYEKIDQAILSDTSELARGGSTAVTAILINGRKLWVGNVGDSRAVLSRRGQAVQMTTDHDPNADRGSIENTGGFVSNMPGFFLPTYDLLRGLSFFQFLKNILGCGSMTIEKGMLAIKCFTCCSQTLLQHKLQKEKNIVWTLMSDTTFCRYKGCFVCPLTGDVPRVNGQLAVSRAFGDKNLKTYIRSDPDVRDTVIDGSTDVLVLASDGLWKVMGNQDAIDIARRTSDPQKAAKQLTSEALKRDSKDDISCVVVRFH